jgi:hypothetical protein
VIVAGPPTLGSAEALVYARASDASVVVVRRDQTKRDALAHAVESLTLVGANVLGVVMDARSGGRFRRAEAGPSAPPVFQPAAELASTSPAMSAPARPRPMARRITTMASPRTAVVSKGPEREWDGGWAPEQERDPDREPEWGRQPTRDPENGRDGEPERAVRDWEREPEWVVRREPEPEWERVPEPEPERAPEREWERVPEPEPERVPEPEPERVPEPEPEPERVPETEPAAEAARELALDSIPDMSLEDAVVDVPPETSPEDVSPDVAPTPVTKPARPVRRRTKRTRT